MPGDTASSLWVLSREREELYQLKQQDWLLALNKALSILPLVANNCITCDIFRLNI